jgi:GWxTD domain-containing protein
MVAGLLMAGSVNAKKMQAHLSYATFYAATSGPYVETYLAINPASIMFKPINDTAFRGIVEVTMIFKNGDEIAAFEKYNLRSPIVTDTNNLKISLLDQKRFLLPSGDYTFTLLLADKYAGEKPYIINEPISISYHQDSIAFSDIQFIDNYRKTTSDNILSKSGYDLIPYPAEFFPENKTVLTFYTELYQTSQVLGTNEKFLLKYYLKSVNTGRILDNFVRIKRMETKEAVPILQNFNITDLASGNYLIIAEAYNKNNELMTKQQRFFKRNNPRIQIDPREVVALEIQNTFVNKLPEDSIREFIRMLNPIASETERYFIENNRENQDLDVLKKFFYQFWITRAPYSPEQKWNRYYTLVKVANKNYGNSMEKGYESDRGKIFVKYGKPNAIASSYNNPAAYPHEIWHYYETENHRDSKFVFYTHDMVTNNFELIHSNVPGEVKNRQWRFMVFTRSNNPENVDSEFVPDTWGSKIEYWDLPY